MELKDFTFRINDLRVGLNTGKPNDGTGFVQFGKDLETVPDDGSIYMHVGSTGYGGVYTRFAFDRTSFIRMAAAAASNARLLREAFRPEAILLTPLDGSEPIKLVAATIRLDGDHFIVVDELGAEQRFKAVEYTLSLAIHEQKVEDEDEDE